MQESPRIACVRVKDIVVVLLALVALGSVIVIVFEERNADAAHVAKTDLEHITKLVRAQQEILIEQTRQTLVLISKLQHVSTMDAECSETLASLLADQDQYANFGVVTAKGIFKCSAVPFTGNPDVTDRLYFKRAMASGGFAVGEFQISRAVHRPTINFAYAFKDRSGDIIGVSVAALDLAWLREFAQSAALPPDAELSIIDDNGIVLVQYAGDEIGIPAQELGFSLEEIVYVEEELGVLEMVDADDIERFVVAAPVHLPQQEGFLHIILSVPVDTLAPRTTPAALWYFLMRSMPSFGT